MVTAYYQVIVQILFIHNPYVTADYSWPTINDSCAIQRGQQNQNKSAAHSDVAGKYRGLSQYNCSCCNHVAFNHVYMSFTLRLMCNYIIECVLDLPRSVDDLLNDKSRSAR